LETLDSEITSVDRDVANIEKEIRDLENYIAFDFGPNARYAYMHDQNYLLTSQEYTYTLKTFKEVTQGHTRVGSWGSWQNDYSVMKYENGERCWGGPDRSIAVHVVCGKDTQIIEVKEPNKCEYFMKMKTPGACTLSSLDNLRKKLLK